MWTAVLSFAFLSERLGAHAAMGRPGVYSRIQVTRSGAAVSVELWAFGAAHGALAPRSAPLPRDHELAFSRSKGTVFIACRLTIPYAGIRGGASKNHCVKTARGVSQTSSVLRST